MKKILFFILCFSITLTVKALEKEPIPNVFYKVSGSSEKKQMYYLHDGDNPLYFYDADIEITTDTEEVSEMPNFDENKLQYIKLANKVYRDNKSNINYYLSIQKLLLTKLSKKDIDYYDENDDSIDVYTEYRDMVKKVEDNLIVPSFNGQTIMGGYKSHFEFTDANNVLSNFTMLPNKNEVNIDKNKLDVVLKEAGNSQIVFRKTIQNGSKEKILKSANGQYYLEPGNDVYVDCILKTSNTSNMNPDLLLQVSSNNKPLMKSLTLELKNEYSEIIKIETDSNGIYKGTIPVGEYEVTILNMPDNFEKQKYNLTVEPENNQVFTLDCLEKRGTVHLKRQGTYLSDKGKITVNLLQVVYEIYAGEDIDNYLGETYKKGDLITSLYLNELGEVSYTLPYGSYYLVEKNNYPYLENEEDIMFNFDSTNNSFDKTIMTEHIGLDVDILNQEKNDLWNLCYKVDGKLLCLKSSNYYSIPFGEYYFMLERNGKTVEYKYDFNKEGYVKLDFNDFFKKDVIEKENNLDELIEKKEDPIDWSTKEKQNNDNVSNLKYQFVKTLPKTSNLNSDLKFCMIGFGLLSSLCYYFSKKDKQ